MLGLSVPWRFGHGERFHGGAFWAGMNTGPEGMASLFSKSGAG
jgi:hypothetical protein